MPGTAALSRVASVGLLLASSAFALALAECVTRRIDGFGLTSLRLAVVRPREASGASAVSRRHGTALPRPADVDLAWFDQDPPPLRDRPRDPQLEALVRTVDDPVRASEATRIWNRRFVVGALRQTASGGRFAGLPDALFVFVPATESSYPRYRLPGGITTPAGISTNRLGFRGPDIPLDKPPGVLRLAFVGASTTQGPADGGFSYPERVVHWLNLWLATRFPGLRADGINAGREGIESPDIAAIVRDELVPLEPDLVVYYEGSNQFSFRQLLLTPEGEQLNWEPGGPSATRGWLENRSALARRLFVATRAAGRRGGREAPRPAYILDWPTGLSETDPDLSRHDLPAGLTQALIDLEAIRSSLGRIDAQVALCSFAWMVHDGLVLDPIRDAQLYDYLNRDWWPYRYRDMRRVADFQNRTFRKYARERALLYVPVAEKFPDDPVLFGDAIHMRPAGMRLMAWVVFLELLPWLEARIESGALPRADRQPLARHPNQSPRWSLEWRKLQLSLAAHREARGRAER